MEELFRNYKVYVITIIVCVFLFIGLAIITSIKGTNDNNKEFKYADYVKTIDTIESNGIKSELPYINLKSDKIEEINEEIAIKFYETIALQNSEFIYEYFINDNIISLLIKISITPENYSENITREYISYNIDYKNLKVISNNELLERNNITMDDVSNIIKKKFEYFYQYEVENNYINGNLCDFNCYTKMRNVSFPTYDAAIVMENNELYAYKPFNIEILLNGCEPYYEEDFKYKLD